MNTTLSWWLRRAALLLFLLVQFYLAKRISEPYPCIILPGFTLAYEPQAIPTATCYHFILQTEAAVDTLSLAELFPDVPPIYRGFTARRLFEFSATEQEEWVLFLQTSDAISPSATLRMEHWERGLDDQRTNVAFVGQLMEVKEIKIDDGVPQ